MVTIYFKLADIKLESFEAYLLKFRKICRRVSKVFTFFCKNAVSNADISNVSYLQQNK